MRAAEADALTAGLAPTEAAFVRDVAANPVNAAILKRWGELALPDAWLVAGCVVQTVWNLRAARAPDADIRDYDLFYFDDRDLDASAERTVQARVQALFADLGATIEVANQARVHCWYEAHFGRPYPRLTSSEDGIGRFLIEETCVGVRPGAVVAPFGLARVEAGTLTANAATPYPELFAQKVASYQQRWPRLVVREARP